MALNEGFFLNTFPAAVDGIVQKRTTFEFNHLLVVEIIGKKGRKL